MSLSSIIKENTANWKALEVPQKAAALNSIYNVFEQSTITRDCSNAIKKASKSKGDTFGGVPPRGCWTFSSRITSNVCQI